MDSCPSVSFQIEKIIDVIAVEGSIKNFKVQWAPSWVSSFNLFGCEKLIKDFCKQRNDDTINFVGGNTEITSPKEWVEIKPGHLAIEEQEDSLVSRNDYEIDMKQREDTEVNEFSDEREQGSVMDRKNILDTETPTNLDNAISNVKGDVVNIVEYTEPQEDAEYSIKNIMLQKELDNTYNKKSPNILGSSTGDTKMTFHQNNSSYDANIKKEDLVNSVYSVLQKVLENENSFANEDVSSNIARQDEMGKLRIGSGSEVEADVECEMQKQQDVHHTEVMQCNNVVKVISAKDKHKCDTCGMNFVSKRFFSKHQCYDSNRYFYGKSLFDEDKGLRKPNELNDEIISEDFKCKDCGLLFTQKELLEVHTCLSCTYCKKNFTGQKSFDKHVLLHSCTAVQHKDYLTSHMLIHSGTKKFQCDVCGKKFGPKTHLTSHMLIHSGVKKFQCEVCGKKFKRKACLTRHMFIHTGFQCKLCGSKFSRNSRNSRNSFNNHICIHK